LKKYIIISLIIIFLFFFVGIWYPVTRYSFRYNSGKIGHFATPFPTEIIDNSPDDYEMPFSIYYFWESIVRSFDIPELTFLLNKNYEKFHLYYIEYNFDDTYFKYEINRDFIINYNSDRVYSNGQWSFGGYYHLSKINFGKYFQEIKPGEIFILKTNIVYQFDDEEIKTQELNYIVEKRIMAGHYWPFGLLLEGLG
jgi:hypothetical protein